jgi:hypothetical protein
MGTPAPYPQQRSFRISKDPMFIGQNTSEGRGEGISEQREDVKVRRTSNLCALCDVQNLQRAVHAYGKRLNPRREMLGFQSDAMPIA